MKRLVPPWSLLLLASGCAFNPGHDYDVVASWLVNGQEPDAALCRELGIDRVRLTMRAVGDPVRFEAPCEDTYLLSDGFVYGALVTTVSFDYGVPYQVSLEALDEDGKTVHSAESSVTSFYGDALPVELAPVEFFDPEGASARFSAAWRFGAGDLSSDCEANEVSEVAVWLTTPSDPTFAAPYELFREPCAAGTYDSMRAKILARGSYLAKYVAFDERGGIAEQSEAYTMIIDRDTKVYALDRHVFKGL